MAEQQEVCTKRTKHMLLLIICQERKKTEMKLEITQKSTTAGNIAFLLLSFPLGLFYFIVTVVGLTVGVSTVILWVGLPLLFVTLMLVRGMAAVERRMVAILLRIHFPFQPHSNSQPPQNLWRRFGNILRDPLTWTSAIYMIIKLPLGILSFTLALVLPIVSFAVTALPLAYLINLFVNAILLKSGIHSSAEIIPYFIEIHDANFDLMMFARTFIGIPIGLGAWFVTRFLLNGLALVSGELARALLSPGETEVSMQQEEIHASFALEQEEQQMYAYRQRS